MRSLHEIRKDSLKTTPSRITLNVPKRIWLKNALTRNGEKPKIKRRKFDFHNELETFTLKI